MKAGVSRIVESNLGILYRATAWVAVIGSRGPTPVAWQHALSNAAEEFWPSRVRERWSTSWSNRIARTGNYATGLRYVASWVGYQPPLMT